MASLSGYLYTLPDTGVDFVSIFSPQTPWVTVNGALFSSSWQQLVFHSPEFIAGEQQLAQTLPFDYGITVRQSPTGILVVLADSKRIAEIFIRKYCKRLIRPPIKSVTVKVGELVNRVVEDPNDYALTAAYARVSAFGEALTSISFYGGDLANAKLFRENLPLMNPFTCGLRKISGASEVIRISSDGSVTVSFDEAGAAEVVKVLGYMYKNGFLNGGRRQENRYVDDDKS